METLISIIMGFLGIILYYLFKLKDYIGDPTFSVGVLVYENLRVWIWAMLVLVVIALLVFLEPKANDVIKTFTGLDLDNTRVGWALFGAGLCGIIRNVKK